MWGAREEQRGCQTEMTVEQDKRGVGKAEDEKFGGSCPDGWSSFGKSKLNTVGLGKVLLSETRWRAA